MFFNCSIVQTAMVNGNEEKKNSDQRQMLIIDETGITRHISAIVSCWGERGVYLGCSGWVLDSSTGMATIHSRTSIRGSSRRDVVEEWGDIGRGVGWIEGTWTSSFLVDVDLCRTGSVDDARFVHQVVSEVSLLLVSVFDLDRDCGSRIFYRNSRFGLKIFSGIPGSGLKIFFWKIKELTSHLV